MEAPGEHPHSHGQNMQTYRKAPARGWTSANHLPTVLHYVKTLETINITGWKFLNFTCTFYMIIKGGLFPGVGSFTEGPKHNQRYLKWMMVFVWPAWRSSVTDFSVAMLPSRCHVISMYYVKMLCKIVVWETCYTLWTNKLCAVVSKNLDTVVERGGGVLIQCLQWAALHMCLSDRPLALTLSSGYMLFIAFSPFEIHI